MGVGGCLLLRTDEAIESPNPGKIKVSGVIYAIT